MGNGTDGGARIARKPMSKGLGECPKCGRGRALVSVKPRPKTPGETTTYCRWDDCRWARVVPFLE